MTREKNAKQSYLLVDKQRGLAVTCVAKIETSARFNDLIIEIVCHLWFWITVHKPHQIDIMILGAIGDVMLASQKSIRWNLNEENRSILVEMNSEDRTNHSNGKMVCCVYLHGCLCISIVWWSFDVEISGEVW